MWKRTKKNAFADREVAQRVADGILNNQRRLANWLNNKAGHCSRTGKLGLLILFCTLWAGWCIFTLRQAFAGTPATARQILVNPPKNDRIGKSSGDYRLNKNKIELSK